MTRYRAGGAPSISDRLTTKCHVHGVHIELIGRAVKLTTPEGEEHTFPSAAQALETFRTSPTYKNLPLRQYAAIR